MVGCAIDWHHSQGSGAIDSHQVRVVLGLEYEQRGIFQEHAAECTPMLMLDPVGWVVTGWAEVSLGMNWAALEGLESRQ